MRQITLLFILLHVGAMFDIDQIKQDWKTVVITLAAVGGIIVIVGPLGYLAFGKEMTVAAIPPLTGGGMASILMSDAALEKGFEHIAMLATHYNNYNALSVQALISAYSHGGEWVDALNGYIRKNTDFICDFFHSQTQGVRAARTEGTYLSWLNFTGTGLPHEEVVRRCTHEAGVILNDGRTCIGNGDHCMRMSAATSRRNVEEAVERIRRAFSSAGAR